MENFHTENSHHFNFLRFLHQSTWRATFQKQFRECKQTLIELTQNRQIIAQKAKNLIFSMFQVTIPIFGDQPSNAFEAEFRGYGQTIPLPELTSEKLLEAVTKVLNDPSYAERAQKHGKMVMDQMQKPLEKAIWWIEYALRYPKMEHLRSPIHDLHWTQYFLLDVLAFLAILATLLAGVVWFSCRFCFRKCCGKKEKSKKE